MRHSIPALLLVGISACTPIQGDPGPVGAPGADGAPGPAGAPGEDGYVAGSRLTPEIVHGDDDSQAPTGRMYDTGRDEACTWQTRGGELLCLPRVLDANTFNTWTDPECTKPGFVARYAPVDADYPEGSSVVQMPGGEVLMRGEEVSGLYTNGSGLPCQPLVSDGFPPPYYHWPLFDPSAFVSGVLVPSFQ